MDFYEVFTRTPVNANARKMFGGEMHESAIDNNELRRIEGALQKKKASLGVKLHVKTKAQRKNLMYRMNIGERTYRAALLPEIADEWRECGKAINIIKVELSRRLTQTKDLA